MRRMDRCLVGHLDEPAVNVMIVCGCESGVNVVILCVNESLV